MKRLDLIRKREGGPSLNRSIMSLTMGIRAYAKTLGDRTLTPLPPAKRSPNAG